MPRYYFNTRFGDDLIKDEEGEVLRDADHAWDVARAMVRELIRTENNLSKLYAAVLEVTDMSGEIVLEFPFSEAMIDALDPDGTRH